MSQDLMQDRNDTFNEILKCKLNSENYMKEVLIFLNQHSWIYNGHMTQILSDPESSLFRIPSEWNEHLLKLSSNEIKEIPYGLVKLEWPESLKEFVTEALRLGRLRFLQDYPKNSRFPFERPLPPSILKGIKPKKLQEIEGMARLVASICSKNDTTFVLDIGAGMGYLDQVLHYRFGLTVLGVDATFSNGAQERTTKSSANKDYCSINIFHEPFTLQDTCESRLVLEELITSVKQPAHCSCQSDHSAKQQIDRKWVIVALHACGDLTRSVLNFYHFCSAVASLVCLSCCYHKMRPDSLPFSSSLEACIHASSEELIWTRASLGIYGLRLASEETRARWSAATNEQFLERINHVLFRATIDHTFNIRGMKWKRPQRRIAKSAFESFQTYCEAALIGYDDTIKTECLNIYARFREYQNLLGGLKLLQILLQPVLESIILLDRACYLKFDLLDNIVWLEPVAEEFCSPRNIAIVSIKNCFI